MKSGLWDEKLLAEHRAWIKAESAQEAFDVMVKVAALLPAYLTDPAMQGDVRIFRYVEQVSGERLFAFIINRRDLLFYVRETGITRVPGGISELRRHFAGVKENNRGEWTVRIASGADAERLNAYLFGTLEVANAWKRGIPDGITRHDVLGAIHQLNQGFANRFGESTKFDIVYEDKRYPPKAVIGIAAKRLAGRLLEPRDFTGGESSKCFRILQELGFDIQDKPSTVARPPNNTRTESQAISRNGTIDGTLPTANPVGAVPDIDEDAAILQRADIGPTMKQTLVSARRGQGLFRERVVALEGRCRVTHVSNPEHLRASHIKPWKDSSDSEKLDGNNGLLLAPHVDHLFDQGYIAFSDTGDILVSRQCPDHLLVAWGIDAVKNVGPFREEQRGYLDHHRKHVLKR